MKNTKKVTIDDAQGSKVAFLFVFLTIVIGSSALLPTSVLHHETTLSGVDGIATDVLSPHNNKQTGRYLKVPSRF